MTTVSHRPNTPILYRLATLLLLLILLLTTSGCFRKELRIGVTTTLVDSGLMPYLVDQFNTQHSANVKLIVGGSGHILRLAQASDVDIIVTHDTDGEQALIASGIGKERYPLMYNDFIIVGPKLDPAHVQTALTMDEALRKIDFAKAPFISRGDNSGTHKFELKWRSKLPLQQGGSLHYSMADKGMGLTLTHAVEQNAYTIVDRATWLNFADKKSLKLLFEDKEILINQYSVTTLNPEKHLEHKTQLAKQWLDWLLGPEGKRAIANFTINDQQVYFIN